MGVFDDVKYDKLDWMSQITETIDSHLNILLTELPDRMQLDAHTISNSIGTYSRSISVGDILLPIIVKLRQKYLMRGEGEYSEHQTLCDCFQFEADDEVEFDAATGTLHGNVYLVKKVPIIEDADLQKIMGYVGIQTLTRAEWRNSDVVRVNEMLDILCCDEKEQKGRSINKKMRVLTDRLRKIFTTNEWRIRDMELADNFCSWIGNYIQTGNLDALVKITKLKVMTHSNMPIYSVKEET